MQVLGCTSSNTSNKIHFILNHKPTRYAFSVGVELCMKSKTYHRVAQFGIRSPVKLSLTWVQQYHIRHVRIFFFHGTTDPSGPRPPHYRLHDHTQTHHTRQDSPRQVISPTQKPQRDNTHKTQTSMPLTGFEPTITARESLRPRGHWDWPHTDYPAYFIPERGNKPKYSRKIKESLLRGMPASNRLSQSTALGWGENHYEHCVTALTF